MDRDDDRSKPEDDDAAPSKAGLARERLGLVAHYVMLGFAPVVSVLALVFAVMAYIGTQSNHVQLGTVNSRIDGISAAQAEPKGEMDIFEVSLAHEKALLAEERKKHAEHEAKIVKDVTQLQVKMKVSPTLEEQLREGASAPAVAPPVAVAPVIVSSVATASPAPAAAPVPVKADTKPPIKPAAKPVVADKKPAPAAKEVRKPAPVAKEVKKPAPAPTSAEKAAKAKVLKKTIEDFNKSDRK
jgi:hypothetical protein